MRRPHILALTVLLLLAALLAPSCGAGAVLVPADAIRIGAVFPLAGDLGPLAAEERAGVEAAVRLVNADGGVDGRQVVLTAADVETAAQAQPAIDALRDQGVQAIIGTYSSALSVPVSIAAAQDGLVYWEAGAVADQVTGRGLPMVFRVGADGAQLGQSTATFTAENLAPRLGVPASHLRVSLVTADDDYAHSVADSVRRTATASGMSVVSESIYSPYSTSPDFGAAIADIRAARPDILVLSSHIPDGVLFRRAFLAAGLHVKAFLGSTMAQCLPTFGEELGPDAIGVFASDRPGDGFDPATLPAPAHALFDRFARAFSADRGHAPTEEGISGFAAAWPLLHDVLPAAARRDAGLAAGSIAASARAVDLPAGTLVNGAGLRFAASGPRLGQNLRAASVIWQWQAVRSSVVVWPAEFATGTIAFVPLPR